MGYQNWEKLLCDFFFKESKKDLSDYFSKYGFLSEKTKIGGILFHKKDVFIEITYEPETYPEYFLSVVLGIGRSAHDESGVFYGVPLWYLLDDNNDFSRWSFSNEKELEDRLKKLKSTILEKYVVQLLLDKQALEKKIELFKLAYKSEE